MPGTLIPIGGAEDSSTKQILGRFVQLCGAQRAHILVIPSASSIALESAAEYEAIFATLGAGFVCSLDFIDRQQADESSAVELLNDVTGVFLTGGDQMKLLSLIGGTRFGNALRSKFMEGVHISGTSAGASAMSRQMIGFGKSGFTIAPHMVHLASGLGLSSSLIIDQHFSQRKRLGRLMTAVMLNTHTLGIGLDEDTALVITPDGCCEVMGSGTITLVNSEQSLNAQYEQTANEVSYHESLAIYRLQSGAKLSIPQATYII